MTADAQPAPEPADDFMALAEAVGVTVPEGSFEASIALMLTDDRLDAVVSSWSRDYAQPFCSTCKDEGIVDSRDWYSGREVVITCPSCGGDDVTDRGGYR